MLTSYLPDITPKIHRVTMCVTVHLQAMCIKNLTASICDQLSYEIAYA